MLKGFTVSEIHGRVSVLFNSLFNYIKLKFTLLGKVSPYHTALSLLTLGSGVLSRHATKVKGLTTTFFNSCFSTTKLWLGYVRLTITHFPEFLHVRYLRFYYMVIHKYAYFIYYRFLLSYIPASKSFKEKFDKSKFRLVYKK